jgi:hypothetical protein
MVGLRTRRQSVREDRGNDIYHAYTIAQKKIEKSLETRLDKLSLPPRTEKLSALRYTFVTAAQSSAATKLAATTISRSGCELNDADNAVAGVVAKERIKGEMVKETTILPLTGKDKQHEYHNII